MEQLGKGNYALVFRGICKESGDEFALKRINKASNGIDDIDKEIDIMLEVSHDYCVGLYEVFDTHREVVLVMELCEGGELFERIMERNKMKNKFTEHEGALIFSKLVCAVQHLHSKGIIHRDIKPENILMMDTDDDLNIKLADFNLSKLLLGDNYTTTVLGTMGYCAPEVISHKPYTFSVDIWSLGVLLYIILAGFPPFPLGRDPMAPIKTKQGKFSFPKTHWAHISDEAKDFIRKMLVLNPDERIPLGQMHSHPWLVRHISSPAVQAEDSGEVEMVAGSNSTLANSTQDTESEEQAIRQRLQELLTLDALCSRVTEAGISVTSPSQREMVRRIAKEVLAEGSADSGSATQ